jgi:hypothetical protein
MLGYRAAPRAPWARSSTPTRRDTLREGPLVQSTPVCLGGLRLVVQSTPVCLGGLRLVGPCHPSVTALVTAYYYC